MCVEDKEDGNYRYPKVKIHLVEFPCILIMKLSWYINVLSSNLIHLVQIAMENVTFKYCCGIDYLETYSVRGVMLISFFSLSHDLCVYFSQLR